MSEAQGESEFVQVARIRDKELAKMQAAALALVKQALPNPTDRQLRDPQIMMAAMLLSRTGSQHYFHHSRWNDLFVIATTLNVFWEDQQAAAWGLLTNSLNGYFEPKTHWELDTLACIRGLGIVWRGEAYHDSHRNQQYTSLIPEVCEKIADRFDLPACGYRPGYSPTRQDMEFRDVLNAQYHPLGYGGQRL